MRVKLKNFQSWKEVDFSVKGLTTITGQNNTGKSALIRALKGAFTNNPGLARSFLKHGEDTLSVEVDFEDGNSVLWERGVENRYVINSTEIRGWGQGIPEALPSLGVRPIHVGNINLWPQIADQFEGQLFLIDSPSTIVAEAITDVSLVSKLTDSLKHAEQDLRSLKSELKVKQKDKLSLEVQKLKLTPIFSLKERYLLLKKESERLSQVRKTLTRLQELEQQLTQLTKSLSLVSEKIMTLEAISGLSAKVYLASIKLGKLDTLNKKEFLLKKLLLKKKTMSSQVRALPEVDYSYLLSKCHKLKLLSNLQTKQVKLINMRDFLRKTDSIYARVGLLESPSSTLKPRFDLYLRSSSLNQSLVKYQNDILKLNGLLEDINQREVEVASTLHTKRSEIGICPLCLRSPCND